MVLTQRFLRFAAPPQPMLEDCRFADSCLSGESASCTKPVPTLNGGILYGQNSHHAPQAVAAILSAQEVKSVRTSDLGWMPFSLTWFPGSLGEGEPRACSSCSLVLVFWSTFTFLLPFSPSCLYTEFVRSRPVVSPSAGTGRFPRVQPCLLFRWFWVEQLALASPPEHVPECFPLLHMPST